MANMDDQESIENMDKLLIQLVLETREISQKKDEINQQINIFKANIAEKKSYIEATKSSIRKHDEEICQKQLIVKHLKANAQSLKATNNLLHQYEEILQLELERRQEKCNHDMKVQQERIESYKKVFQKHKEHYCENPLARKFFMMQSENGEIECRIKASDEQIGGGQRELEGLCGQTHSIFPIENSSESVTNHVTTEEPRQQQDHQTDTLHKHIDISSLHLTQPKDSCENIGDGMVEQNLEEIVSWKTPALPPFHGKTSHELGPNQEAMDQLQQSVEVSSSDCNQESVVDMQEEHPTLPSIAEEDEREAVDKEQEPFRHMIEEEEEDRATAALSQSSPCSMACPQTSPSRVCTTQSSPSRAGPYISPRRMKAVSSTPTFSLTSSPSSSPGHQEATDAKSPAFLFSISSAPTTPGFSGFDCGFEMASPQEEGSPFTFTSSYFCDKKPPGAQSSSGFPFDQTERTEDDFQFSFTDNSPEQSLGNQEKGGSGDAFPFSLNFGKF